MKIENHVAQLLYRYPCVTVPGFGAFIANISSAEVNTFTQTFSPPRKNISFNANIQSNDGLLTNHIATIDKVGYEAAVLLIDAQVETWKQQLNSKETITLKSIGNITANEHGHPIFEAFVDVNFLTSSFGLNSYVSPTIKREVDQLMAIKNKIAVEPKLIRLETPTESFEIKPRPNYLSYAAAVVIGLGTLGFVGNTFYQQQVEVQNQITQNEVRKEVNQRIQKATFFISNPFQYTNLEVAETDKCFHIVSGSFRSKRNVANLLERMIKMGYNPKALPKDSLGVSQVLFGSYSTFGAAQAELEKIQSKENPEAWILIKKL